MSTLDDCVQSVARQRPGWLNCLKDLVHICETDEDMGRLTTASIIGAPVAEKGFIYLALLHAINMESSGFIPEALNGWWLASCRRHDASDIAAMEALKLGSPAQLTDLSLRMRSHRSRYLKSSISELQECHGERAIFRIARAISGYLGEASVFSVHRSQRPKLIFVPGLAGNAFLDLNKLSIITALRDAHEAIRDEFDRILADSSVMRPFLEGSGPGKIHGYVSGGEMASWDAIFFYRHGNRVNETHARCPETSALLDSADLCRIDGQSPEICFSVLQPHTRIEPHHGVTNARVVVHLPLRVPKGCRLNLVGVGEHEWQEGEPVSFDDTFEHSAENPTDHPRGILLMDAWHPDLTDLERQAFQRFIAAVSYIEQPRLVSPTISHG